MMIQHDKTAPAYPCAAAFSSQAALFIGLLVSTAPITPAVAETSEETAESIILPDLRIEARAAQQLLGNNEITSEQIEDRNPYTVKDIYAGESSVTVSGGASIAQKVFVQGIEESLLSVTIDGARQNKSAFHHTGNILLDPTLLKRVEITSGLAPADAGPGGLGGSIAYETKDARDLLDPDDPFGGLLTLGATTNGTDLRGTLTLFGQNSGFEYLLSVAREVGTEYEDGDGKTVPGTEPDLTAYVGKLAYTTQSGKRISFSASKTEDKGERAAQAGIGGLLFIRPDFAEVVGSPNVLVDGLSARESYTLTYTDEAPRGWFAPYIQLTYNEQEVDAVGVYGLNTSFSGTLKNLWELGNGTLSAGLDFFSDTAEGKGRGEGPGASSGEEKLWDIGLFAQARQDLSDRISASYGLRVDIQEFEGADGSEFSAEGLSGNGALDIILTDSLTLNAGVASTWGGYELGEAALVNFFTPWNYDGLKPSRANSGRIGLRFENGPFAARGAIFRTEIDDISAVLPLGGNRGTTTDMTSEGFDGSVSWTGDQGFAVLNYTYSDVKLDGEVISTTAYYFGRPIGHMFALEGRWDINPSWALGGTAEIALENNDTEITLPGYEALDLYASFRPEQLAGLELRLDVRNVFDETFQRRSSDGIDSARVVALNEPGRTFGLTARWHF